jgi:hypothetical protein
MTDRSCDECKLHSGVTATQKAICAKVLRIEQEQEAMWLSISKRAPLWAFVGTMGIIIAVFGHLYITSSSIRDIARDNSAAIKSELTHVNESLREIKRNLRHNNYGRSGNENSSSD